MNIWCFPSIPCNNPPPHTSASSPSSPPWPLASTRGPRASCSSARPRALARSSAQLCIREHEMQARSVATSVRVLAEQRARSSTGQSASLRSWMLSPTGRAAFPKSNASFPLPVLAASMVPRITTRYPDAERQLVPRIYEQFRQRCPYAPLPEIQQTVRDWPARGNAALQSRRRPARRPAFRAAGARIQQGCPHPQDRTRFHR